MTVQMRRAVAVALVIMACLGWQAAPTQAHVGAGLSTVTSLTLPIDQTTLYYDEGPHGSPQPDGWWKKSFDDSQWDRVVPVTKQIQQCMTDQSRVRARAYWGTQTGDYYIFRSRFVLPAARNYYHSTLYVGTTQRGLTTYLNEQKIREAKPLYAPFLIDVSTVITGGVNTLVVRAGPGNCDGLAFTLNVKATGVQTGTNTVVSTATPGTSGQSGIASAAAPLFGHGPELYLSTVSGPSNTPVTAKGLGFTPGEQIGIVIVPLGPGMGFCEGAGKLSDCTSLLATVDKSGVFSLTFPIKPSPARLYGAYQVIAFTHDGREKAFALFGLTQ